MILVNGAIICAVGGAFIMIFNAIMMMTRSPSPESSIRYIGGNVAAITLYTASIALAALYIATNIGAK